MTHDVNTRNPFWHLQRAVTAGPNGSIGCDSLGHFLSGSFPHECCKQALLLFVTWGPLLIRQTLPLPQTESVNSHCTQCM